MACPLSFAMALETCRSSAMRCYWVTMMKHEWGRNPWKSHVKIPEWDWRWAWGNNNVQAGIPLTRALSYYCMHQSSPIGRRNPWALIGHAYKVWTVHFDMHWNPNSFHNNMIQNFVIIISMHYGKPKLKPTRKCKTKSQLYINISQMWRL